MRLLVYEHRCGALHGVIDSASIPEEQLTLAKTRLPEVPEYDYMAIDLRDCDSRLRCKDCDYLDPVVADDQARCRGKYRTELDEREIARLPEQLQRVEEELKEAELEAESLRDDLDDAEEKVDDMRADSEMARVTAETLERLVKDIELYLAQVAVSRTAYANAGKHLQFICDLAQDARKRLSEVEISA
jgi:DNA repair exonuclease SbcCD ATPase subunit